MSRAFDEYSDARMEAQTKANATNHDYCIVRASAYDRGNFVVRIASWNDSDYGKGEIVPPTGKLPAHVEHVPFAGYVDNEDESRLSSDSDSNASRVVSLPTRRSRKVDRPKFSFGDV